MSDIKIGDLRERIAAVLTHAECRTPAYGAPGIAHCAACCGGTGWAATSADELALFEALDRARWAIDAVLSADTWKGAE